MTQTSPTSTLLTTEHRMRGWVLGTCFVTTALSGLSLIVSLASAPRALWLLCASAALAPILSNAHYLRTHEQTTVGMMPIAFFSLLPACVSLLASSAVTGLLRTLCIGLCCILGTVLALFMAWFIRLRCSYRRHPTVDPEAALIVLGGAIKKGRPCQTLARRLDVAADLWHNQPSLTIVVSGGPTPTGRTTEAREMARYLGTRGVRRPSILLEPTARNTRENIDCSVGLLQEHGFSGPLCVVSSDYHLWRAQHEAQRLGISLTPIPAPTPRASVPQQWCREVLTILAGR